METAILNSETPTVASGRSPEGRFTIDGDAALEAHLAVTCERIAAGLRGLIPASKLEAVLLGGGYGRGEGGVLRTSNGDRPYNDLEFYVCIRGNRHLNERRFGRALHVLGEILTPQAGIEVEFHVTSLRELAAAEISMFSYDLVCGHRWLIGGDHLLADGAHHREAPLIPLTEGSRLLMNRCAGLLFAAERLSRPTLAAADRDFVARNIAKAQLGAGDAVLTTLRRYHWSVIERHQQLRRGVAVDRMPWVDSLARHHAAGVEFKLHPQRSAESLEALQSRHHEVSELCRMVWLWLESRRLGVPFTSVQDYVASPKAKHAGGAGIRNRLVNAKVFGAGAALRAGAARHPRDRILNALPLLLWQREELGTPGFTARLQPDLATTARDFSGLVQALHRIWAQVN